MDAERTARLGRAKTVGTRVEEGERRMIRLVELRGLKPLTLCLQNRGRTESTFENFALSTSHASAKSAGVHRFPPSVAVLLCCTGAALAKVRMTRGSGTGRVIHGGLLAVPVTGLL
jgi:hypothetical protein